jgi:transposase
MTLTVEDGLAASEGRRGRRRWSEAEKGRIVAESEVPGSSVSVVARRHDVNANQVFTWRRELRRRFAGAEGDGTSFVPAVITGAPGMGSEPATRSQAGLINEQPVRELAGRMEIILGSGERVIVGADVDAAGLSRVVAVLSRR